MICASSYALIFIGFGNPFPFSLSFSLCVDNSISSILQLHFSMQKSQMKPIPPFTKYLTRQRILPQNEQFSVVVCFVDIRCQPLSIKCVRCNNLTVYIGKIRLFLPLFSKKVFLFCIFLCFFRICTAKSRQNPREKHHLCYGQTKNASVFACKYAGIFADAKIRLPYAFFVVLFMPLFIKNQPFFLYTIFFFAKALFFNAFTQKSAPFGFPNQKVHFFYVILLRRRKEIP